MSSFSGARLAAVLVGAVTLTACSDAGDEPLAQFDSALSEVTFDSGEIAYGGTETATYFDDHVPKWRFRGRQGDIVEVRLDGGFVSRYDGGNFRFALELLVQDMGGSPVESAAIVRSSLDIEGVSLRLRLPYNGNYFLLARNTTGARAQMTARLGLLAGAGKLFQVDGTGAQKNTVLTRRPDCSAASGESASLRPSDATASVAVTLDGTVQVVPPTVGRCSPQTLPALAGPKAESFDATVDDPSPPWQVSCEGPKPLSYRLEIAARQGRPPYAGAHADDVVTVKATCEDLAGRTEYTFTGALPRGVFF